MSRRTVVTALAGALLVGGLAAPGLAGPLVEEDGTEYVCVRLISDPEEGKREGFCAWVPVPVDLPAGAR